MARASNPWGCGTFGICHSPKHTTAWTIFYTVECDLRDEWVAAVAADHGNDRGELWGGEVHQLTLEAPLLGHHIPRQSLIRIQTPVTPTHQHYHFPADLTPNLKKQQSQTTSLQTYTRVTKAKQHQITQLVCVLKQANWLKLFEIQAIYKTFSALGIWKKNIRLKKKIQKIQKDTRLQFNT